MKALTVLAFAALLTLPPAAAQLPEGCSDAEPGTYTCRWVLADPGAGRFATWEIPMFDGPALATFTVVILQGPDSGYNLTVQRIPRNGEASVVSQSYHPATTNAAIRHQGQSTHVLEGLPGDTFGVVFRPGHIAAGASYVEGQAQGTFEVSYLARRLPDGIVPARPAATADDPHIEDVFGEAARPAWDLRAAWLNDARLEDGLFDAHLRVGDLGNITRVDFDPPTLGVPLSTFGDAGPQDDRLSWKISWNVSGEPYYVEWSIPPPAGPDVDWRELRCELRRESTSEGEAEEVLAHPVCSVDVANATFHADIPVASIGSPTDGERFEAMVARTRIYLQGFTDVVDDTPGGLRYAFALGGPAVWSDLNPRLDPPPTPWYVDPLAPENIADTVQLSGALVAVTTFFVGLFLVVRRRKDTARLLARVDAIEESGVDSADVLLRLGKLEQEFNLLFRRHKISEAQYQVLSQRIAGVATRFALRRSLGLDDGVPGEEGPIKRVPVRSNDPKLRP